METALNPACSAKISGSIQATPVLLSELMGALKLMRGESSCIIPGKLGFQFRSDTTSSQRRTFTLEQGNRYCCGWLRDLLSNSYTESIYPMKIQLLIKCEQTDFTTKILQLKNLISCACLFVEQTIFDTRLMYVLYYFLYKNTLKTDAKY